MSNDLADNENNTTRNISKSMCRACGGITINDFDMKKMFDGLLYRNSHKFDIASGGEDGILIETGELECAILLLSNADGDTEIEFFFEPTITDYGTEEPAGNLHLHKANENLTKMYYDYTLSAQGLQGASSWMFGGSGVLGLNANAASSENTYLVIPAETKVLINFVNHAGRALQVFFRCTFFEEEFY